MGDEDDKAKKLAHEIRGATESTEFDLASYGADQCDRLAQAAFAKPLPLDKMIRLSFLVGGGKKVQEGQGLSTLGVSDEPVDPRSVRRGMPYPTHCIART